MISPLPIQRLLSSLFICSTLISRALARIPLELKNSGKEFNSDSSQANAAFPVTRIYLAIPEESPPGSLVVDLNANPLVKNVQATFESGPSTISFQYRLVNTFDGRLFRVGSHSGRMTIASRLDREFLCASQKAQFCCNTRNSLPSILTSDPNWKEENDSIARSQLCHLVAHVSIQSTALRSPESEINPTADQMALIYVYIRLDDVNDHTPQFTSQSNSLNVAEDTPVGTVLNYFQISDPDSGVNGLKQVKLDVVPLTTVHDSPTQTNQYKENPFETKLSRDGVSLLLVRPLDRETVSAYDVILTAIDGDRLKPRSSQLNLRVHVTDANDNPPVWVLQTDRNVPSTADYLFPGSRNALEGGQIPRFNVTVPENAQVGALIYWLQAKDNDVGDNARLQYSIDTSAPGGLTALDYFSVQSTTGEVRLRTQLDFDSTAMQTSKAEIEVPVVVRDSPHVGRQLTSKATLVVQITDVNDMYPIIMASPLQPIPVHNTYPGSDEQGQTTFGVWENRPPGQPIASILVNDPDTGDGGRVSCSVQSDFFTLTLESEKSPEDYSEYKNLETDGTKTYTGPVTYHLLSSQRLDREAISKHQLVLTCRDHDRSRPLISTQRLEIEVLDENDNAPEFSSPSIVLTCPENSPPGQVIGRLNATDKDLRENAKLRFWVDDRDASWIGVQATTGEVRVNTVFDRETEKQREFIAYVVDSDGPIRHTASTTATVRVLDENDHAPHFTDLYFFSIPENSPPGTEVGYVRAEDADEGENGKVHYLINPPNRDFEVDAESGKITVRASGADGVRPMLTDKGQMRVSLLDREQQDTYELTLVAEDGGSPPRRATTVVHIGLSDVNDHAPQFRYPTPHGPGSVLNVSCAQLSTQLIARVHANDSDSGRNGEVEYSIVRENTFAPRFPRHVSNNQTIPSTTTLSPHSVGNFTKQNETTANNSVSTDSDNSAPAEGNVTNTRHVKSAPITDPLLGGPTPNHFEINSHNGQLFLIHPIMDCSRPVDIRLLIRAKDGGEPSLSSTAMLTIHIRPTEESSSDYDVFASPNGYRYPAQSGITKDRGRAWTKRTDMGRLTQRKPSASSSAASTSQFLSSSSHWSAIVGLIVAMVILVLLLCIMLFVLRRKLIGDEHKIIHKNQDLRRGQEKHNTSMRPMNEVREIYYKAAAGSGSIHEMGTGSSHQNSMSPATVAHLDELNCSSMSLVPNQSGLMSAHYFCAVPSSTTTVTLNTGEVAVLHHENERRNAMDKTGPPNQILYGTSAGELYGYLETQSRQTAGAREHMYQTLQPRQAGARQTSLYMPEMTGRCRANGNCFTRNLIPDKTCCAQNSQYTPLLRHAANAKLLPKRQLQASQPDLTNCKSNERTRSGQVGSLKGTLIQCERALSLSDLTAETMPIFRSPLDECQLAEGNTQAPLTSNNYTESSTNSQFSNKHACNPSTAICNRAMKSLAIGLDQPGNMSGGQYNRASFV